MRACSRGRTRSGVSAWPQAWSLRDGQPVTPAELQEFVGARLARFKVPKEIGFSDRLPRTVSGKLLRRELGRRP